MSDPPRYAGRGGLSSIPDPGAGPAQVIRRPPMTAPERRRASAPPIPRPGVASDAALDDLRRRLYIGISALGIGIQAAMWILNLHRDAPDPVTTYTNPLFTVLSSWVIWWMARRRPVEIVNWVGLSACGLVIILRAV